MDLTKRQFREIGGRVAVGNPSEFTHPGALKGALAEFISTLIFVFVGIGSAVAYDKMTGRITEEIVILPAALVAGALSHGFAMFVAVSVSVKNSGGHVNPAITFAALLGGHITLIRGLLYWVAQLLGSVAACLLLKFLANGLVVPGYGIHDVTVWNALVMEIVLTFGLVYTVYATTLDPKKGNLETIAPLSIGMIVVANTLVGGIFTGAAMNPAIAFGPAIVSWYWTGHWVYWAGPLVGSGLAAIIYHLFFISSSSSATDDVSSDY